MPMKAIVDYDYKAEASDELSLKVGEVILDIIQVEDGWCKGQLNGKVGMFPDNFVTIQPEVKSPSPKPTKKEVKRKVKVIFAYDPANQDELKLAVGDVIEVLVDEEEGWARGSLRGSDGVFPTNFTEPMKTAPLPEVPTVASPTEPPKVSSPTTMLPADNAAPTSATKKVKGVGLGNIFDGPIKLRTSSSKTDLHDKSKMNEKRLSSTKLDPAPPAQQKIETTPIMPIHPIMTAIPKHTDHPPLVPKAEPAVTTKRYKVMFDYQAENEDELTLKKGEIVNVDNMNLADVGWWSGNIKDQDGSVRYGVFPDNFVAPASMEEVEKPKQIVLDSKAAKAKIDAVLDCGKSSSTKVMSPSSAQQPPLLTGASSMKRQAPKAPAPPLQSNKPSVEMEPKKAATGVDDSSSAKLEDDLPATEESKLTHFKRAPGPKNRKKPDAGNRREKANEANAAAEIAMTTPSTTAPPSAAVRSHEPASSEPTTNGTSSPPPPVESPTSVVPSKRDHKRGGIQVMPVMPGHTGGGDASTDKPSWMKNLKSRKSEKRTNPPPPSVAPAAAKEETNKPPWLAHLKKTKAQPPKSTASPAPAPTPKPVVPTPPASHARTSSTPSTESASDKPSTASEAVEKTLSVASSKARLEPEMKTTSEEAGSLFDNDPPQRKVTTRPSEIKKSVAGPRPVSMTLPMSNKFGDFGAKKSATISKPRPPPLTSKPTLPANKPSSSQPNHSTSSALDELKEEMKLMKEQMHKMQLEQKQETHRLQNELEEERNKRLSLQGEVNQLKKLLHK